jgi:hypothetical protein
MLFALIVLLSTAMSVQAMESKTMERHNGAHAYASWDQGSCFTDLSVTKTDDGTEIHLYNEGPGGLFEGAGYLFTEDDVFKVNNKLKSASLSEVQIDVIDYTGEKKTVTVHADWTGEGDTSTGSSSYTSKSGDYKFKSSESSSYRDASVIGSINGYEFNGYEFNGYEFGGKPCLSSAFLSNFESASITMGK